MPNRLRLFIFFFSLLSITVLVFLLWRHKSLETNIPTTNLELSLVSSAELNPIDAKVQYIAERLIRGYVQSYDGQTQVLNIRYQLNPSAKEEIITFPLTLKQTVYCWPQYKSGIDVTQAFMPISPQTLIYIEGEQAVFFDEILDQIIDKYIFLQTNEQGKLAKLAIVACYE